MNETPPSGEEPEDEERVGEDRGDECRLPVERARDRIASVVDPLDRTETLPVGTAVGRPLAGAVTARRPLPHYDRASVDGFALRAADAPDATGDRSATVGIAEAVEPGAATRVDVGDPLPDGADAVVPLAGVTRPDASGTAVDLDSVTNRATELVVDSPVSPGEGVEEAGAQFAAGETVFDAGRPLRRSDPALCAAVGRTRVEAVQRPTVGVVPTGDGLATGQPEPEPGAVVETNGRTLSVLVQHWGGKVTCRDGVDSDPSALRAAVQRDLTKDLLVTTGGTGRGERDRLYDVVDSLGEVEFRGSALEPGGTVGLAVVRDRPVVLLPGDPVGCLVAAVQLLGPAVTRLARRPLSSPTTVQGELTAAIESRPGVRTAVPVAVDASGEGERRSTPDPAVRPLAEPATATLRSVAGADGWVVVPESAERRADGESVTVETWTASR